MNISQSILLSYANFDSTTSKLDVSQLSWGFHLLKTTQLFTGEATFLCVHPEFGSFSNALFLLKSTRMFYWTLRFFCGVRSKAPLDTNPKLHEIPSSSFQYTTSMFLFFSLALHSNLVIQRYYHVHCNTLNNIAVSQKYLCKYSLLLWVYLKLYIVHNPHHTVNNISLIKAKISSCLVFKVFCFQIAVIWLMSIGWMHFEWQASYFPLVPLTTSVHFDTENINRWKFGQ